MKVASKKAGTAVFSLSDRSGRVISRKFVPFLDGEPAIDALKKAADIKSKPTEFGEQIVSVDGINSEWFHFFVKRKGEEKEGMPFIRLPSGKRAYLDLRNMQLSSSLDGIEIRITVVSCCSDLSNSVAGEIDGCYSDFRLHEISSLQKKIGSMVAKAAASEFGRLPDYLLQQLLLQSKMPHRRLRDLYVEKMLSSALRRSMISSSDGMDEDQGDIDQQTGTELSFFLSFSVSPDMPSAPIHILARAATLHSSAGQVKKERAKLKELGPRATANEKEKLASLEEDILKRGLQLEALMMRNLETARSSVDCPAGAAS